MARWCSLSLHVGDATRSNVLLIPRSSKCACMHVKRMLYSNFSSRTRATATANVLHVNTWNETFYIDWEDWWWVSWAKEQVCYILFYPHRRRYGTTLFRPEKQRATLSTYIFLGEVCWVVVVAGCRWSVAAEMSGWSEVQLALSIVGPRVRLIGPDILMMITVMCSSLHRCVRACMPFYGCSCTMVCMFDIGLTDETSDFRRLYIRSYKRTFCPLQAMKQYRK